MAETLAVAIPLALGALVASLPVVAMSALLATLDSPEPLTRFTSGWVVGLLSVGVLGLLVVDGVSFAAESVAWAVWLRLALGILLLLLAVRGFVKLATGSRTAPSWMTTMREVSPRKAFGVAFLLAAVNPKSATIVLAAVSAIATVNPAVGEQVLALALFAIVASLGVAAPQIALLVAGNGARAPLERFVAGFERHGELIVAIVLALLGLALVGSALVT